jgi:hypothetical protein
MPTWCKNNYFSDKPIDMPITTCSQGRLTTFGLVMQYFEFIARD